jgi:hypothetical protein
MAVFAWGVWRIVFFDPATDNDIPGAGYFVLGFMCSMVAYFLYQIRCDFLRRKAPAP